MQLKKYATVALAGLALVLPLSGCSLRTFHVLIPDFVSDQIQGVNVFRLDDTTGAPVLVSRIDFVSTSIQPNGQEIVSYQIVSSGGTTTGPLPAVVVKDPSNPDSAEMLLMEGLNGASGWFKVSSFNAYGSSPLSTQQTYLE